jgi:hypothetical protein
MQKNWLAFAGAVTAAAMFIVTAQAQQKPSLPVQIPNPGVPEAMTIEGKFVRAAYNNEGYAIIGYQVANRSIGEEYMMIDLGTTVRSGVKPYKLTRDKLEVTLPDGKNVPLLTQEEYRAVNLSAIEARAKVQRDSINYFPPEAHEACRIGFFAQPNSPAMSWTEVELSSRRGCVGRLFFKIPGGIKHGQYFLNVKFEQTLIRVPFRILTEEEEKFLSKNYKAIDKQVEEAFKPKKK